MKASNEIEYATFDTFDNKVILRRGGFTHHAVAFGLRYELGKYFGKSKSKLRFGLSGGLEPSFYFYKMEPNAFQDYPVHAKLFTIELSVIPMLSVMLSKKVSLDFKAIPNMLLGDFGGFYEKNPAYTKRQQKLDKEYSLPELNMAFSILLRYNIKEPKK